MCLNHWKINWCVFLVLMTTQSTLVKFFKDRHFSVKFLAQGHFSMQMGKTCPRVSLLMCLSSCVFLYVSPRMSLRLCLSLCLSSCVSLCVSPLVSFFMSLLMCLSSFVSLRVSLLVCLSSCVSLHVSLLVTKEHLFFLLQYLFTILPVWCENSEYCWHVKYPLLILESVVHLLNSGHHQDFIKGYLVPCRCCRKWSTCWVIAQCSLANNIKRVVFSDSSTRQLLHFTVNLCLVECC